MRTSLALLAGALLLAGCGGGSAGSSAGAGVVAPDHPAPPIAAVDQAPSELTLHMLGFAFGVGSARASAQGLDVITPSGTSETCYSWSRDGAGSTTSSTGSCSPELQAQLLAQLAKDQQALRPAPGTDPRVVATLALDGGGTASFTAWTTAAGAPCWIAAPDGGGGGGPTGPCSRSGHEASPAAPPCDALCLSSSGSGSGENAALRYLLAGTVPAGAEAIRVTLDDGSAATYPLRGPTLLELRDRRILMLDLGGHDWRKLELVENGEVVRTVEMPKAEAAIEDCRAKVGWPHAPGPDTQMQACLDASGAFSSSTGAGSSTVATTTAP